MGKVDQILRNLYAPPLRLSREFLCKNYRLRFHQLTVGRTLHPTLLTLILLGAPAPERQGPVRENGAFNS
jgi:hypothetical protein